MVEVARGVAVGFAVGVAVGATVGVAVGFAVGFAVTGDAGVVLEVFTFLTVTLHVNFFFPTVACTFAVPFFLPLTDTATLPFFFKEMYFFPDRIFHFTFFFVFLTLSVLLFPFVTVNFLVLRLTFFAADTSFAGINPSNKAKESRQAVICFFLLIIFVPP
ncbi:MAG TPA: hypothetical protein DHW28_08525 [Lachnospiraceae bacterium]|nr:hypothetical protein [Lachnospiraceae bacterium]